MLWICRGKGIRGQPGKPEGWLLLRKPCRVTAGANSSRQRGKLRKTPRNWVKTQAKPSWVAEGGKKRFLSVLPRVCPSLGYAGREIGPEAAPGLIPWGHPGRTQPREGREGTGSAHPEGVVAQRDGGGAAAVGHGVGLATGGEGGRVAGLELGVVDWGREREEGKSPWACAAVGFHCQMLPGSGTGCSSAPWLSLRFWGLQPSFARIPLQGSQAQQQSPRGEIPIALPP